MIEPQAPLERLNYYNGQRLEATDFRLEQDYHIRVRRQLNQALYTTGIASGLEVFVLEDDPHTLVITPGLALDYQGREIILLEEAQIKAMGLPSETEGVVFGNYLTIRYQERVTSQKDDQCNVGRNGSQQRIAWGGPARVRAEPVIEWQNSWPTEESGMIVLAQVELDENCAVRNIRTSVRRYVGLGQPPRSMVYALEGEKDIDMDNPKLLYFHVRGGRPEAVTLYFRGEKFSSLYYTELGRHNHDLDLDTEPGGGFPGHDHSVNLGTLETSTTGNHRHEIYSDTNSHADGAIEITGTDLNNQRLTGAGGVRGGRADMEVKLSGDHSHTLTTSSATVGSNGSQGDHHHAITGTTQARGMNPAARTGPTYTYLEDLQIWIDGTNYSEDIKARLGWTQIGDGTSGHALQSGSGPIAIDTLGPDLSEGEHTIEFRVSSGGGRIFYNLYVE